MPALKDIYTSTGHKFFAHEEAMQGLRAGRARPITSHIMLTDICQHKCSFCSVQTRVGDTLPFSTVTGYLDILCRYGLKSVILSGGGNPILYRDKESGAKFDDVVANIHERGLEIGLITNGMPLKVDGFGRKVWRSVSGATLDKLTWIRISMAGLDHTEREVFVPDIDPKRTTLGFSWVYHDQYDCPEEPNHGSVSTPEDLIRFAGITNDPEEITRRWRSGAERLPEVQEQIRHYVKTYQPRYVRLLPNCLEPSLIPQRCEELQGMANAINLGLPSETVFVQNKPPRAPDACFLGYIHPVLNCDSYVYPCDSVVLNEAAGHKFDSPWRVCHWSEVARLYEEPVHSLVNPKRLCPGCVFSRSNDVLGGVVDGTADITPPETMPEHAAFV